MVVRMALIIQQFWANSKLGLYTVRVRDCSYKWKNSVKWCIRSVSLPYHHSDPTEHSTSSPSHRPFINTGSTQDHHIMTIPSPTLYFLYVTTHRPTGAVYVGIHASQDINFGTDQSRDPFIGGGDKVRALNAPRSAFEVRTILVGTYNDCLKKYRTLPINYDHPLCLNTKEGAPADLPKA